MVDAGFVSPIYAGASSLDGAEDENPYMSPDVASSWVCDVQDLWADATEREIEADARTTFRRFLEWLLPTLVNGEVPLEERRILSVRGVSPADVQDAVSRFSPKPQHWTRPVFLCLEDPFSGENLS